jgi:hypothetical protein
VSDSRGRHDAVAEVFIRAGAVVEWADGNAFRAAPVKRLRRLAPLWQETGARFAGLNPAA